MRSIDAHCAQAVIPPFLCPTAQINGGDAKPNWYKCEYKRAKQENREPDYRWGADLVTRTDVDPPVESPQCPAEEPQPQRAAAAMMHGVSRPPASSWQGGCPTIAEHQEFMPPMQPSMQAYVILPNPGYKIEANLWNLDVQRSARIQALLHHFFVIAIPWIAHTFQVIGTTVLRMFGADFFRFFFCFLLL